MLYVGIQRTHPVADKDAFSRYIFAFSQDSLTIQALNSAALFLLT